ncbi:unnamed protein product [Musa acuminata subsp. burmannicoides]
MSKASHWSVSVVPTVLPSFPRLEITAVERIFLWDHGVSTSPRIINCSASGSPAHCGTLQRALPSALVGAIVVLDAFRSSTWGFQRIAKLIRLTERQAFLGT